MDALRKRIRRGKLETVKGNDGLVRVRLMTADMEALRLAEGQPKPSQPDESDRTVAALEAERDAARLAAAKAEGESATLRERMESEREREEARIAAATAEGEARGLREALAEARRPFWRRWLG